MWLYSYELYGQRAKGLYVQYPKDWLLFFWLVFMVVQGSFMVFHFFKFTIVNDAIFCSTIRTDVFEVC